MGRHLENTQNAAQLVKKKKTIKIKMQFLKKKKLQRVTVITQKSKTRGYEPNNT